MVLELVDVCGRVTADASRSHVCSMLMASKDREKYPVMKQWVLFSENSQDWGKSLVMLPQRKSTQV